MKTYSRLLLSIIVCAVFCSCKRSKEAQYDSWANKAVDMVTNAFITNGWSLQTNSQGSEMVGAITETVKSDMSKKIAINTAEAGQMLLQLRGNNHLPGVSKDEHGRLDSEIVPMMVSNKLVIVSYPVQRTFHLVKEGETSTNNYILVKQSKDSEWKLQKAWLTDSNGQLIKEWPVQ
jgi:hypothetical protein